MSIPEAQLETWSHQGSVTQSASTYAAIRNALIQPGTGYAGRQVDIFLQGSYGNATNVYADSDVDVVIQYGGAFYKDVSSLTDDQKAAQAQTYVAHDYIYETFRADVQRALTTAFPNAVTSSNKALKIAAGGGRRLADVVPSFDHRRFTQFQDNQHQTFAEGMTFWSRGNRKIVNYPKLHAANLTAKHQRTSGNLKAFRFPDVR